MSLPPAVLQDVAFGLDVDSVDRSLASAAHKFFPLCARVVRIRKFVDTKRRYIQYIYLTSPWIE